MKPVSTTLLQRLTLVSNEVSVEAELDHHVQVAAQPVASEADLCHDALDAMDMGDVESGVDSDFEFDTEDDY